MLEKAGASEIRRLDYIGPMASGIMVGILPR